MPSYPQSKYRVLAVMLAACLGSSALAWNEESSQVEHRLVRAAQYLAADQLGGRGLGTPELQVAADFIYRQFERMGLEVEYQTFTYTMAAAQGPNNRAALVHRQAGRRLPLRIDTDLRPLAIGEAGNLDTPCVFVGYGITAPELDYDDYDGLDVAGKTVIVLRHEPQQGDANSRFNGADHSPYAPFRYKVKNAIDHHAAAIIFCTDLYQTNRRRAQWQQRQAALKSKVAEEYEHFAALLTPTNDDMRSHLRRVQDLQLRLRQFNGMVTAATDELLPFDGAGMATSNERIPVVMATRQAIDRWLAAADRPPLETIERTIDQQGAPASFALGDWHFVANVDITRKQVPVSNVVATLEGEGPLANETIVVGAHFDHLGRGKTTHGEGVVHNGADDNASGVSMLLETAAHYATAETRPPRRMVFVAFTGEERGLLGSAHYVAHPVAPLESTAAMFNFDMVGRLSDNRLIVNGTQTAADFSELVDDVNERHGFELVKVPGGLGPSDHASFYSQDVPVLHFFTGLHNEYHRPSDDVQLLNIPGMRRIQLFAVDVIDSVLLSPTAPRFTQTAGPSRAP